MSSYYTTVYINDNEWDELNRKVNGAQSYVLRKQEEALRLEAEIVRREQELRKMREQAEKTVQSAIILLEGGFRRTMGELSAKAKENLTQQTKDTGEALRSLKEDIRGTAAKTNEASARMTEISRGVADALEALVRQEKDNAARARVYVENLTNLMEQISGLSPEAFEPRAFMELRQMLGSAQANISAGRYEASLVNTQAGLLKASSLLTRLILTNNAFHEEIAGVTELGDALKIRFDRFDSKMDGMIEVEIEGEKRSFEFDLDHWSEGRFTRLKTAFEAAYKELEEAREKRVPVSQLEILKKNFETLGAKLDRCDAAARAEMLGSLRTQETAARLCDSLLENDWELEDHGFDEEDDRNPYKMTYVDPEGNKISVVVSPDVSAEKPSIFFEAFAEDDSRADIVKRNVLAMLPQEGLRVDQAQRLSDCKSNSSSRAFFENTLPRAEALNQNRRRQQFGL